jgi:hypothetical protein
VDVVQLEVLEVEEEEKQPKQQLETKITRSKTSKTSLIEIPRMCLQVQVLTAGVLVGVATRGFKIT